MGRYTVSTNSVIGVALSGVSSLLLTGSKIFQARRFDGSFVWVCWANRCEPFMDMGTNTDTISELVLPIAEHPTFTPTKNRSALHGGLYSTCVPSCLPLIPFDLLKCPWKPSKYNVFSGTGQRILLYESTALPLSYLGQDLINSGDLCLEPWEFRPYFVQNFPSKP